MLTIAISSDIFLYKIKILSSLNGKKFFPHPESIYSAFRDEFRARVKKSGYASILPVALVQQRRRRLALGGRGREEHLNSFTDSLAAVIMPWKHICGPYTSTLFLSLSPRFSFLSFNKSSYCAKRMARFLSLRRREKLFLISFSLVFCCCCCFLRFRDYYFFLFRVRGCLLLLGLTAYSGHNYRGELKKKKNNNTLFYFSFRERYKRWEYNLAERRKVCFFWLKKFTNPWRIQRKNGIAARIYEKITRSAREQIFPFPPPFYSYASQSFGKNQLVKAIKGKKIPLQFEFK